MRILSLDWDTSYQRDLAAELEAAGHQVDTVTRVTEAMSGDAKRPYDLFVVEARLPDRNGLQFLRELRLARGPNAPRVIFLTDVEDDQVRARCLAEGAARFLSKKDGWAATVAEIHGVIAEFEPQPAVAAGTAASRGEAPVFRGNLETIDLVDIVQLLNVGKKTGVLVLMGGPCEGRIFFDEGEVVAAACGLDQGAGAFAALLPVKRGAFRFEAGPLRVERTIHQSTSTLMLDALRLQDENERKSYAGAPVPTAEEEALDFDQPAADSPGDDWLDASLDFSATGDEGLEPVPAADSPPWAAPAGPSSRLSTPPAPAPPLSMPPSATVPAAGGPPPVVPVAPPATVPAAPPHHHAPPTTPARAAWPPEHDRAPGGSTLPPAAAPVTRSVAPRAATAARNGVRPSPRRSASSSRRRLVLLGAAAAALVAGIYFALASGLLREPAGVEGADYSSLMLQAADNQARIDSLEQVITELARSARPGGAAGAAAARRLALVQGELRQASAELETTQRVIDR